MRLTAHPQVRSQWRSIGREGAPLLVIDHAVADPERLVRRATTRAFATPSSMFPGLRAPAPLSYQAFLEATLQPLLQDGFGIAPGRFAFPLCHYSLVAVPPERLTFLQRVPHIDSVSPEGLATVHYLFRGDWGGTAFYRHRRSGFESVDPSRHRAYYDCLAEEGRAAAAATAGYIGGDTPLFERIAEVDGVFNRLIVYRRNSLHSGSIDNGRVPPPDPLAGRLSINSFIDVVR